MKSVLNSRYELVNQESSQATAVGNGIKYRAFISVPAAGVCEAPVKIGGGVQSNLMVHPCVPIVATFAFFLRSLCFRQPRFLFFFSPHSQGSSPLKVRGYLGSIHDPFHLSRGAKRPNKKVLS